MEPWTCLVGGVLRFIGLGVLGLIGFEGFRVFFGVLGGFGGFRDLWVLVTLEFGVLVL